MKKTTINDAMLFKMKQLIESNGTLMPIEFDNQIPFKVKRTFLVSDVDTPDPRGMHSHYKTKQLLICVRGSFSVMLFDGNKEVSYTLKSGEALYIPNLIWDEQIYHTKDTILMSLCSTNYDIKDYIHDKEQFKKIKNG
jgi:dTDP-4-dehydrorhamnose 3,5-epimerase-like enzyme